MATDIVELGTTSRDVIKEALMILIDQALDCNDKEFFLLLSRELQQLNQEQTD